MQPLNRPNQSVIGMIQLQMINPCKNQKPTLEFILSTIFQVWETPMLAPEFEFEKEYSDDDPSGPERKKEGEIYEPKREGEIYQPEKEGEIRDPKKDKEHQDFPKRKYHEDFFPDTELYHNGN